MIKLNLTPQNKQEELILNYLQNNASETLADKINNGTPFEKDGHPLLNKKTLSGFMKYACDEARKLAEKGANSACIDDATVYGWAIHFFEEDSIEGTLYTIDGEEYKPAPKKVATTKPVTVKPQPTKPQNLQFSIFDKIDDTEVKDTKTDTLTTETDTNDDETDMPSEEEMQEIFAQVHEEEQRKKGNAMYQKYMSYQAEYKTAIVAYRLGDFYEVFGDKAVLLGNELDLTITSRDVGLKERIPMVGFPYHAAEKLLRENRKTSRPVYRRKTTTKKTIH
ncbi:MAG: Cas9 inhibitor AcrIIA9 family protein [Clostridium sp.]|nr:MAG: Cas9 inhibitor AcrIIA9 family protein [Clostridium sp.]